MMKYNKLIIELKLNNIYYSININFYNNNLKHINQNNYKTVLIKLLKTPHPSNI